MIRNLAITAAVALSCGVIGAMGYLHFFTPESGESTTSHSKTEAGTKDGSSVNGQSAGKSGTTPALDSSTRARASIGSSVVGYGSTPEFVERKEQITNLDQRIDRLGQQVDGIQRMLGLALPLLLRISPKS
jgi:hypothetical protein